MTEKTMTKLTQIKTGKHATLKNFCAGKGLVNRMNSLGLTPGAEIEMVQNIGRGPLIICVRGARIALGRGEADQLLVEN